MAAKAYLEKYIDCVDSMPIDVQRIVSQLRELDRQTQQLLPQLHRAKEQCERLRDQPSAGSIEQQQWASQLHQLMVSVRHMGNEKLELTSEMMDIVEDYTHQLALREKDMDNCRTREDANNLRLSSFTSHPHKIPSSPLSTIDSSSEKRKIDRAHKRSRMSSSMAVSGSMQHDDDSPPPPPPPPPIRDPPSKAREGSSASIGAVNSSSRPPKKKAKLKKSRSSSKDSSATSSYHSTSHIPTPDFSTEPIDPDEPTYCLCQQVSFGEMIGCDNDNCQIEWFHFQCVGLTSKPKGKWYCPQCSNERAKHRTTK